METERIKDLLKFIVLQLVDSPEAVSVTVGAQSAGPGENASAAGGEAAGELVLELRVAKEDMGKVIGRQGRIAKEIRTIIRSAAGQSERRVSVEIVD